MFLRCPCQSMRMETIKWDLKYPFLAMATAYPVWWPQLWQKITAWYVQCSLCVYVTYIKYEWKQTDSFPEAFCQTPSTEAVNISCQPEQPFTSLRTEPCYSCAPFQAEPILESWIRPDHIIYSSPVYGNSVQHPLKQQTRYLTIEFRHLVMVEHWFLWNRTPTPSNSAWQL